MPVQCEGNKIPYQKPKCWGWVIHLQCIWEPLWWRDKHKDNHHYIPKILALPNFSHLRITRPGFAFSLRSKTHVNFDPIKTHWLCLFWVLIGPQVKVHMGELVVVGKYHHARPSYVKVNFSQHGCNIQEACEDVTLCGHTTWTKSDLRG